MSLGLPVTMPLPSQTRPLGYGCVKRCQHTHYRQISVRCTPSGYVARKKKHERTELIALSTKNEGYGVDRLPNTDSAPPPTRCFDFVLQKYAGSFLTNVLAPAMIHVSCRCFPLALLKLTVWLELVPNATQAWAFYRTRTVHTTGDYRLTILATTAVVVFTVVSMACQPTLRHILEDPHSCKTVTHPSEK